MKTIVVDIDDHGNCSISGKGFSGDECDKFISEINQSLGRTVRSKKLPEYKRVVVSQDKNRNRR